MKVEGGGMMRNVVVTAWYVLLAEGGVSVRLCSSSDCQTGEGPQDKEKFAPVHRDSTY